MYKFEVGSDRVIRGWSIGIQSMSVGERASIYIPWSKAYGAEGIEKMIPPKADLIFEIDLYRINGKGYYTKDEKEKFTKKMEVRSSSYFLFFILSPNVIDPTTGMET